MHGVRVFARRSFSQWDTVRKCTCKSSTVRCMSTEAMPVPAADDTPKSYPPKIVKIVTEISGLTLLEVSELNELLKKKLNLPDAPVMPAGGFMAMAAGPAAPVEEEKQEAVKNTFTVKMVKYDEKQKVPIIKAVRTAMEGMNLVQAKKFVESVPVVIRDNCDKEEAEKIKAELTAAGAEIVLE